MQNDVQKKLTLSHKNNWDTTTNVVIPAMSIHIHLHKKITIAVSLILLARLELDPFYSLQSQMVPR